MYREMNAPVKEGEIVTVTIDSMGAKGDGLARIKGFVLFVTGVKQGETVTVRVTKVLQKLGFAELVKKSAGEQETQNDVTAAPEETQPEEKSYEDTENFGDEK